MNEKTFAKDEFIGNIVTIKECSDPSWTGKTGIILDETKNTFLIRVNNKAKTIAKNTALFEFKYKDKKISLDGSKILFQPEKRIKKIR